MLLEKPIEVLHSTVTEERGHGANLCGREDAKQVLSEGQPDLDLKLRHCFVIFGIERPFQRSHFNCEFSRERAESELWISMGGLDEVAGKSFRIIKKGGIKLIAWRSSEGADFCSDLFLER